MSYTAVPTSVAGTVLAAAFLNTYLKNNMTAIYAGELSIASQAANDFLYASSTTQMASLAKTNYTSPFFDGSNWVMKPLPGINRCRVYNNATQSISNSTLTALVWNTERFDSAALHDTVTNNSRITIPTQGAGIWLFVANVYWVNAAATQRMIGLYKAGTLIASSVALQPSPYDLAIQVSAIVDLAAADYVEVKVSHDAGGSVTVGDGADAAHWFAAIQVG